MNKIVVIAPHPDDELLGCGASMAKHIEAGEEVYVIIATNAALGAPELYDDAGVKMVRNEALKAHNYLGVKETFFLDFPAPALNAYPEYKISIAIQKLLVKITPDFLYLPHPGDLHQDHKAIYRSALVAARPQGNLKINTILCYETLSESEWSPMQESKFVPNYFVNVTKQYQKKLNALEFFKSQMKEFPHSRSLEALEALAKYRGSTVGVSRAEAFYLERKLLD